MLYRIISAARNLSRSRTEQAAGNPSASGAAFSIVELARNALTVAGVAAIVALALLFVKPHFTDRFKALSPFGGAAAMDEQAVLATSATTAAMDMPSRAFAKPGKPLTAAQQASMRFQVRQISVSEEQAAVSQFISRRYRVAHGATQMMVAEAYKNAEQLELDPLLILAVVAIESRFNPFAESAVGAQGLMQVMSKVHSDKFREHGGVHAALDPVANMRVGSKILKEYVERGGSVEAGLKRYVGAAALSTDSGYGAKVLAEYRRLQEAAGRVQADVPEVARTDEPSRPAASAAQSAAPAADTGKSAALAPQALPPAPGVSLTSL